MVFSSHCAIACVHQLGLFFKLANQVNQRPMYFTTFGSFYNNSGWIAIPLSFSLFFLLFFFKCVYFFPPAHRILHSRFHSRRNGPNETNNSCESAAKEHSWRVATEKDRWGGEQRHGELPTSARSRDPATTQLIGFVAVVQDSRWWFEKSSEHSCPFLSFQQYTIYPSTLSSLSWFDYSALEHMDDTIWRRQQGASSLPSFLPSFHVMGFAHFVPLPHPPLDPSSRITSSLCPKPPWVENTFVFCFRWVFCWTMCIGLGEQEKVYLIFICINP